MFIDASQEYEPGKNQNRLRDEDVNKIIDTYSARKSIEKYSYVSTINEIEENGFNLNIPRYINSMDEEEVIDVNKVQNELKDIDKQLEDIDKEFNNYLKELGL